MKNFLYILLLYSLGLNAQTTGDTLYLKLDKNMKIEESLDVLGYNQIKLSFAIKSNNKEPNSRLTTYNFLIDNLNSDFENEIFDHIDDFVSKPEYEKMKLKSLEDLTELSDCEIFFLLADTQNIFVVTQNNDDLVKYRLIYLSTQRGWETVKTH
jgi:hypothetical protein